MILNKRKFLCKKLYNSYVGYAHSQLEKINKHEFKGYMGERRKKIVKEHGYDTKKGAHAIRLLRMGYTALKEGYIEVVRPDADELVSIKNGEWSLKKVREESDKLFEACKEARKNSDLPEELDKEKINNLTTSVLKTEFASREGV